MSQSKKPTFNLHVFSRVLSRVGPYRGRFIFAGVLVLVLSVLALARPILIQKGIDEDMANKDYDGLLWMFISVVVLLVIEAVLQFVQTYTANWVAQSVTLDMRSRLYDHVVQFKLRYFDQTPVGTTVTRLISDIDGIARVFSDGILTISGDLLRLIVIVAYMFYANWILTLFVIIPVPILIWATRAFQRVMKQAFVDVRNQVARMNVFVQEHVTGMSVVQIFNRQEHEKERFRVLNDNHKKAHIRTVWAFSIFFPVVEILSASSIAILLWLGMKEVIQERATLGEVLMFILFIFMIYRPIRQLADRFTVLQEGLVNAERVFKVFDTEAQIANEGTTDPGKLKGNISIRNVWFAYDENLQDQAQPGWILKDINLEVKEGQTIAFVGATGAGKSSIINLISRFYEFQHGSITLDGTDIRDIPVDVVRREVAVVLQDVFLFSDSILNNVTLNNPDISLDQVVAAAKQVGAHEFISKLPGAYDYNVRERGGVLSAGQRQLLAFIRAYLYNPSILVLDEATSSVDSESEELIQNAIRRLTADRTSIVIAHRLSTIQEADKIVVLSKGKIVEAGNHQELLQHGGHYKRLFELQFQDT
ncbi:MAG: ABC transporter ATP-binding protein [Flavobacteriales bacterium]|nr:ABC transporter ATP-binding protein [Flavobacteriales bacterium]